MPATPTRARGGFFGQLYTQVCMAVALGVAVGYFWPALGVALRPMGDGFIQLIRLLLVPVVFGTVVLGIARMGGLREAGRVGFKALVYFEIVSTLALAIGLVVVNVVRPGAGMNVHLGSADAQAVAGYTASAHGESIAASVGSSLAHNLILRVIAVSLVVGVLLSHFRARARPVLHFLDAALEAVFFIVGLVMRVAPLAALGGVAFTVGEFGIGSLAALARLIAAVYFTSLVFVFGVLGVIARRCGVRLWDFLRYIREEIVITFATVSTEAVLPRMMAKMEALGCAQPVVGLVFPTGYMFNPDGTAIYLTMASIFLAQATNTPLTFGDQLFVLGVLLLTSKGSGGVAGAGFVALAATLSSVSKIPAAGLVLLLGVDRFINEARAVTNLIGNGVATIAVATWEKSFDRAQAARVLRPDSGKPPAAP